MAVVNKTILLKNILLNEKYYAKNIKKRNRKIKKRNSRSRYLILGKINCF